MIVPDAAAAVELVLATAPGASVAQRLRGETVHAPARFDVEVVGAIRRAVARDLVSDHEGLVAVADAQRLGIKRWRAAPFIQRAYQLRHTHAVADTVYVALAEGAVPLITCDRRLANSQGQHAEIEFIA